MSNKNVISLYEKYVMPTYAKTPLQLVRGKGVFVWDEKGKKYLDFFPGWAVSGIGHCPPRVVKAVQKQTATLMHVSNNYYHEWQAMLAKKIIDYSFPGKVFFCNSGAEANEAAIKLARKFGNPERNEVITTEGSFHGRTLAAVTATGQKKFQKGFEPLPEGFVTVPFNDIGALESAISPKTVAIMMELIQGEGGVCVAEAEYVRAVRRLCTEKNILFIVDEVQTGMGRTGTMFCYENFGVTPDIMTLAKSLGSGYPIGALVAGKKIADTLSPGTHGTTFGGSPVACVAGLATFETIEKEKLVKKAGVLGAYLLKQLHGLKKKHSVIREVRGMALMTGLLLAIEGKGVYEACLKKGLLINCTQGNVLRIMPPLVVTKKEIDQAVKILGEALTACTQ